MLSHAMLARLMVSHAMLTWHMATHLMLAQLLLICGRIIHSLLDRARLARMTHALLTHLSRHAREEHLTGLLPDAGGGDLPKFHWARPCRRYRILRILLCVGRMLCMLSCMCWRSTNMLTHMLQAVYGGWWRIWRALRGVSKGLRVLRMLSAQDFCGGDLVT